MEKQNKKEKITKKSTKEKSTQKTKINSTLNKFIPKTTSELILTLIFIILLIVIILLSIKAVNLKKEQENRQDALVIPILKRGTSDNFAVDLSSMKVDEIKEYKFIITNYQDKMLAKEDINYQIELTNNSSAIALKLYKNEEDTNLLPSNSSTFLIQGNTLSKDKKMQDTYYLIIRIKEPVEKKDNITVKITSIN